MSVRFGKKVAYLEGVCSVEDAEPLLEWLQSHPKGRLNLKTCKHVHAAVLQVLMATDPRVSAPPTSAFLRDNVLPLLK